MATMYLMQAQDSSDLELHTWRTLTPDWAGAEYTGPGTPIDITLSGGGFGSPSALTDGFIVNDSGAFLLNASGAQLLTSQVSLVNAGGLDLVNAGGSTLLAGL